MFVLQVKEAISKPYTIGNCSFPYQTYRWKDVAISESKDALKKIQNQNLEYRIDERKVNLNSTTADKERR